MKQLSRFILIAIFGAGCNSAFAQEVNWKALRPSQKHIINLNGGFDHGTTVGVGYGYHVNGRRPLILSVEYAAPFGKKYLDDFKTKIGGQMNVLRANNVFVALKAYSIFRRFENDFVRMVNFGSEFSGTVGLYKEKWFAAADISFDKAIVTHVKHSSLMKEYNPELVSGWYLPTGGNFLFGVQGGYSFPRNDVYAKVGRRFNQNFETSSLVPYSFEVGVNMKL